MSLIIRVRMPMRQARMLRKGKRLTPEPAALEVRRDMLENYWERRDGW
jgi:hypothetical protein